jgi:hypothetical protein
MLCHPAVISHHPRAICSRVCAVCLAMFKMADIHEQLINYKFCFKLGEAFMEPTYSSDLALANFFLFPKLKSTLKGLKYQAIQEIMENLLTELRTILKKVYQDCFQK